MPSLTVRAVRATPVEVPLNFVLGTSATAIRRAPLLLIDLETEEGVTGRTYVFCYLPAAAPAIMSLLGEIGFRKLARLNHEKACQLADRLGKIKKIKNMGSTGCS
jgi:mandelate racemase